MQLVSFQQLLRQKTSILQNVNDFWLWRVCVCVCVCVQLYPHPNPSVMIFPGNTSWWKRRTFQWKGTQRSSSWQRTAGNSLATVALDGGRVRPTGLLWGIQRQHESIGKWLLLLLVQPERIMQYGMIPFIWFNLIRLGSNTVVYGCICHLSWCMLAHCIVFIDFRFTTYR